MSRHISSSRVSMCFLAGFSLVCRAPERAALNERKPCKMNFITGFSNKSPSPGFPQRPSRQRLPPHYSQIKSSRTIKAAVGRVEMQLTLTFIFTLPQRRTGSVEPTILQRDINSITDRRHLKYTNTQERQKRVCMWGPERHL